MCVCVCDYSCRYIGYTRRDLSGMAGGPNLSMVDGRALLYMYICIDGGIYVCVCERESVRCPSLYISGYPEATSLT